jgi:hypothetical protein
MISILKQYATRYFTYWHFFCNFFIYLRPKIWLHFGTGKFTN